MIDVRLIDYSSFLSMYHGLELEPNIADYNSRGNENGILGLCQLLKFKEALGILEPNDVFIFDQICNRLRTYKSDGTRYNGLFDRGGEESADITDRGFRTISHDNMSAISAFSTVHNKDRAIAIARHGVKNFMVFDNVSPENPRWYYTDERNGRKKTRLQHPRDWFSWLYNAGGIYSLLGLPLFPVFFMANLISCGSEYEETSGKLMAFTRLFGSKKWLHKLTWYFCERRLKKIYGKNYLSLITEIYYKHSQHPVRVLAKVYDEQRS